MQVQIRQHKKKPCLFYAFDGHKLLCVTLSFKRQPNKQAGRGGGGDEGEKCDRKKERDRLPSLPNPPLPSLFLSSQFSTTFDTCYKQVFFLALPYAGTWLARVEAN